MNTSTSIELPGDEFAWTDCSTLADGYRAGQFSPVDVACALLDRIAALDGPVNSIVHVDRGYTLAMAEASAQRWREGQPLSALDGVPATIKDLSKVAGLPRRRGSLLLDDTPCDEDTPCVARLREAGVVFLAKTATPEGGCKVVTDSRVHGVTRNPWDLSRTPGGSSGAAAAALAMGFGPLALGSDGAGSIRIPASHTNVFGLKPSFGRVPAFPPDTDMPHSVVGPMTRTVADAALMLDVMARRDRRDPYAWPVRFARPDLRHADVSGLRIAFSARIGMTAPLVDPEVDALVAGAAPLLAGAGAALTEDAPDWPCDPLDPFDVFWIAGCAEALRAVPQDRRHLMDPMIPAVAALSGRIDLAAYQRAMAQRLAIAAASQAFFQHYDLLIGPVMPVPAYDATRSVPAGFADTDWSWCPYTYPWNMTGQPAASVPIGITRAGLPVGVQIIGPMGGEATILRAARAIEVAQPWGRMRSLPDAGRAGTV